VLRPGTVAADNAAFLGSNGENIATMVAALSGGRADLAGLIGIAPGVEVRSAAGADLRLGNDWNLAAANSTRLGEPVVLTLRAANNLLLPFSLSDGFAGLAASSAVLPGQAASYRLVGGADFSAADPLATRADAAQGDVVIGRAASSGASAPPVVLVRSSTGSIEIAAARDLVTYVETTRPDGSTDRRSQTRIYTTGTAVAAADTPGLDRVGITSDQLLRSGSTVVGPFYDNAGDIRVSVGRDVLGSPATVYDNNGSSTVQYVSDWWYRQASYASGSKAEGVALWSRYDLFAQGLASFGGGDIRVDAGRDIVDLDLSTPSSGYRVAAAPDASAQEQQRWWAGGALQVSAGRDVVGGLFNAGGSSAQLLVGGAFAAAANPLQANGYAATQLFYGADTAWTVTARGDLRLGALTQPALMAGARQGIAAGAREDLVTQLGESSNATLLSLAGDVTLQDNRPASASGTNPGAAASTLPDTVTLAAPAGSVHAADLTQRPVGAGALQALARDGVEVGVLRVVAPVAAGTAVPTPQTQKEATDLLDVTTRHWQRSEGAADTAIDPPVRLVALEGDVTLAGALSFSARALRLIAARDLRIDSYLQVQHPSEPGPDGKDLGRQLTLLQAGRDLQIGSQYGLRLAGAGDVVAVAGRDIDLGGGQGIVSIGNQDNDLQLGKGGAGITLLAGVRWTDYTQAVAQGFHLLGSGFENFPAVLAVQLEALAAGGQLLDAAAAQAAATAFAALDLDSQRSRVEALVGGDALSRGTEAALQQAVARAEALSQAATEAVAAGAVVGSNRLSSTPPVPGSEFLPGEILFPANASEAEKTARQTAVREQLRAALQPRALAQALADHVQGLDAGTRQTLALAVSPYSADLQGFVAQRSGSPVTSAADAAARFAVMAPEQQALFVNRVLTAELRAAGRDALTGQRVGYLRGYDAMDTLFSGARPAGRISLSNSQVKTAQGGDIRLLTPGGSVNVGDLVAGRNAKSASELGVVSVGGGGGGAIDAVVRNSVEVNQSRIFTLAEGDVMLWARLGNLDAGRGAKTVTGSPPPLVTINSQGQVVVDTSGSFSGSGIAVLNAASTLDLYAPMGEINAGEAGIQSAGNAFLGAARVVNADALQIGGTGVGSPVKAPEAPTASLAGLAQAAAAGTQQAAGSADDEDERRRRNRPRRNLFLDFLGFGRGE